MQNCLICNSASNRAIARITADKLIGAYSASYATPVDRLFPRRTETIDLNICDTCDLRWYSPPVAGDDRFYEDLHRFDWYYQDYKPEYDFAKMHISDASSVLEIGCGKGAFRRFLQKNVHYRGLELNPAAVEKARADGMDVAAVSLEEEATERCGFYDIVCNFQVLEHVLEPRSFLLDCAKALTPGGKVIIAVPSEDSFLSLAENAWLNMPPHHLTRWSDQALKYAVTLAGFQIKEIWHEPVADFHTDWYRYTMINAGLKKLVGSTVGLEADRFWSRVSHRLSNVPFVRYVFREIGERDFSLSGRGHTVCILATKQS